MIQYDYQVRQKRVIRNQWLKGVVTLQTNIYSFIFLGWLSLWIFFKENIVFAIEYLIQLIYNTIAKYEFYIQLFLNFLAKSIWAPEYVIDRVFSRARLPGSQ